ncbi:hypothetical protein L7F22_021879 [Adiantum nelumboides]|nr:hypothetical protein [Adiantum nelumboides]
MFCKKTLLDILKLFSSGLTEATTPYLNSVKENRCHQNGKEVFLKSPTFNFSCITHVLKGIISSLSGFQLQGFKSEMLKWTREEAHSWTRDMFDLALKHGIPHDWSTSWTKLLHKGGDANNINNYWTIMVGSLMANLFRCVVLLVHSLEDAQKLMIALENFGLHSGLIVNDSRTKVMLNKEKPCIVYNQEPFEVVESFKYLGLEVSANNKCKDCAMWRLEARKRAY